MQVMNDGDPLANPTESSKNDCRREISAVQQCSQKREPVHARHNQVGYDSIHLAGTESLYCLLAVFSGLRGVAELADDIRQLLTFAIVIVDDQYTRGHDSPPRR